MKSRKMWFWSCIVLIMLFSIFLSEQVIANTPVEQSDSLTDEGQLTPPEFEEILAELGKENANEISGIQSRIPRLYTKHLFVMGHGEFDPGAIGNGTNERDFTRNELLPYLKKYASKLTYSKVEFYDISKNMYEESKRERGAFSIDKSFDSVTEVHLDSNLGRASGGHVIVAPGTKTSQNSALVNTIQKYVGLNSAFSQSGGFSYRSDLFNLRILKERGIPYRLTELGFISNSNDLGKIRSNIDGIAKSMIEAVTGENVSDNLIAGNIDSVVGKNENFEVTGWFLNKQISGGEPIIFVVDDQGRELARAKAERVNRLDVASTFPGISHAEKSGFKAVFPLTSQLEGKQVYFLGRNASDAAGNQSLFDYYFKGVTTLPKHINDGVLNVFSENEGEIKIKGWHVSSKSNVRNFHWIFIIDASSGAVLKKVSVNGIESIEAKNKYPYMDTYKIAGFDDVVQIEEKWRGKTLLVQSVYTLDFDGNQVITSFTFPQALPLCDENGNYRLLTYRVYNKNNGDHLYTQDIAEYTRLIQLGWNDEKIAWCSPDKGNPVYRLYNENTGEHFYTMDKDEYNTVAKAGWKKEDIAFYSDAKKKVGVYRLFNPNATGPGSHHFTRDISEYRSLIGLGWRDEKVAFYTVE